jgi:hypothetical protein
MFQKYGTWSIKSTLPLQGWTKKITRQRRVFETKSRSPPSDAMCVIVDKKRRRHTTSLPILDIASEGGLVDQGSHIPTQSCENLSPPSDGMGGLDGLFSDEVTL